MKQCDYMVNAPIFPFLSHPQSLVVIKHNQTNWNQLKNTSEMWSGIRLMPPQTSENCKKCTLLCIYAQRVNSCIMFSVTLEDSKEDFGGSFKTEGVEFERHEAGRL